MAASSQRDTYDFPLLSTSSEETIPSAELALRARQSSTCSLPSALSSIIPDCAVNCVQYFIQLSYSSTSCSDLSQLSYLCTQPTVSGYTIGEESVLCLNKYCPGQDLTPAYDICENTPNAISETMVSVSTNSLSVTPSATTSTVSLLPSSLFTSGTTTLPSSIGNPASTAGLSSIPSVTTAPTSTSSSSTSADAQTTTASTAIVRSKPVLSTAQIAGIVVAGLGTLVLVFGLLVCIFWLRKRHKPRRPSKRWSMALEQHRPSGFGEPQQATTPSGHVLNGSISEHNPQQRYYAPQPLEETRRSFWRDSIKPEEIGIAVSPEIVQQESPISNSSHKTTSRLLQEPHSASLWPPPLAVPYSSTHEQVTQRPESTMTVFEDDSGFRHSQYATLSLQRNALPDSRRYSKRQRVETPLTSGKVDLRTEMYNTEKERAVQPSSRIPLTPIYDNGQFESSMHLGNTPAAHNALPSSVPARLSQQGTPWVRARNSQSVNIPMSQARAPVSFSVRQSVASDVTNFEEDTTPGDEPVKKLTPEESYESAAGYFQNPSIKDEDSSPIKDLKYPRIPPSAAMSRQAEKVPRPRASQQFSTRGRPAVPHPTRPRLARNEHSFITDNSGSTDRAQAGSPSLLEKRMRENPQPTRSQPGMNLRINTESAMAKGVSQKWTVIPPLLQSPSLMKENLMVEASYKSPPYSEGLSTSKLTPNMSSNGDLYFTVED